jgi:hypothetical protein
MLLIATQAFLTFRMYYHSFPSSIWIKKQEQTNLFHSLFSPTWHSTLALVQQLLKRIRLKKYLDNCQNCNIKDFNRYKTSNKILISLWYKLPYHPLKAIIKINFRRHRALWVTWTSIKIYFQLHPEVFFLIKKKLGLN